MKNTFRLTILFFICAFVVSCQKDFQNNLDPVLPRDSVLLLSKLIYFDPVVSTTDTAGYVDYVYDSLRRITILNDYENDNASLSKRETVSYYYNGTDEKAFKSVYQILDDPAFRGDTVFYFYDSLQRLVKDSALTFDGSSGINITVSDYIYSDSMIIAVLHGFNTTNPQDSFMYADTGFRRTSGDVYKAADSNIPAIVTLTYDTHPNPFYQLNIHTTYYPVPDYDFELYTNYLVINNAVAVHFEDLLYPSNTYTQTYSYTYNSSGLPETASSFFNNVLDEQLLFVYKKF